MVIRTSSASTPTGVRIMCWTVRTRSATRRRPNPKVEAAVHMAGFLILFVVMILVTFKDIKGLFT